MVQPPTDLTSLAACFHQRALDRADRPFLHFRQGEAWTHWSWAEVARQVTSLARTLVARGMQPGDRVGILAENRPQWLIADLACLQVGVVDVPVYPTCPAPEVLHVLRDAGCRGLFLSGQHQWRKIQTLRAQLPELEWCVSFDLLEDASVPTIDAWIERGAALDGAEVQRRLGAVGPGDLASILYTSGTTGEPKGVMLSHGNFLSNCASVLRHVDVSPDDRTLSFLPLSHCFERTAGHYTVMMAGGEIAYASSLDRVAVELREIQPTLVLGVPRFFEKVHTRVVAAVEHSPFWRRKLFRLALRVGERAFQARQAGQELPSGTRWRWELAQKLVFQKLRERIGGRVRLLVSGGAPLGEETSRFFNHAGLDLVEGYGLTETSPVVCCNTPRHNRPGTVGRVIPGVELRIAPDGEILVQGPSVMQGYWNRPEDTREVLDQDGTFHTGDIGHLDDEGALIITDRKKEIIVSSGGKNVSPARVEGLLKRSPVIADVCLIGDRRPYMVALLVPDLTVLKLLAAEQGLAWTGREQMLRHPEMARCFTQAVQEANIELAPPERVRRFALLCEAFSQENRLLTPTLKVRRRMVEQHHAALIEELYRPELQAAFAQAPILQPA